jgi:hypothetical protein
MGLEGKAEGVGQSGTRNEGEFRASRESPSRCWSGRLWVQSR